MQRPTQTAGLAFSFGTLAQNQNLVSLSAAIAVQLGLNPKSTLVVGTLAGLRSRGRTRASQRTILLVLMAVCALAAKAQDPRRNEIPTAPSALMRVELGPSGETNSTAPTAVASVNGTVMDDSGALFPDAKAEIETTAHDDSRAVTAGEDAVFQFDGLKPNVAYVVTVSADGTGTWKSEPIILRPGQSLTLNDIHLRIEGTDSITVSVSREQIAAAQLQMETKQRMFGVIPNFYTVYDGANAVPLTPKLKFQLALRTSIDPATITGVAFMAGIKQTAKTPNYQMGAAGYGQRFGATAATGVSDILIGGAVLPSLLHQDPRYFYQGSGSTRSRLKHALSYAFVTRGDNGHSQFNVSSLGGDLAAGALETAYYPHANRGAGRFGADFALATVERTLNAIAQEFIFPRFSSKAKFHIDSQAEDTTPSQAQQ